MTETYHLTTQELEAGLDAIRQSPKDAGAIELIVRRPEEGAREVLTEGRLDLAEGLVGDSWRSLGSSLTPDGSAHPDTQLTLMNARAIALVAQDRERWPLAGDQLYIDMDLSGENLPPGTRTGARLRRDCGHRAAAHRLPAIQRAVRYGCAALRQFTGGATTESARHQCQSCATGRGAGRRYCEEDVGAKHSQSKLPQRQAGAGCAVFGCGRRV